MERRFEFVRRVDWPVMEVFWLAYVFMAAIALHTPLLDVPATVLSRATDGLINFTLLANLLMLAVIAVILFGWGRLRSRDVGLVWRKLPAGLLTFVLLWLTLQALALLLSWLFTGGASWHVEWSHHSPTVIVGRLIGMLFGVAVIEEIGFRGFLIPQFWSRLGGQWRLVTAVILAQLLFSGMHVPQLFYEQLPPDAFIGRMGLVFLLGLTFAIIYLLSDNLFIAMAFHGLHDSPTLLFSSQPVDQYTLVFLLELLFVVGCLWWRRRRPRPAPVVSGAAAP